MHILEFPIDQYDEVLLLWQRTPGLWVRDADSRDAIERYLWRNLDLSFLAEIDDDIVEGALCDHGGRRG